MRIGQDYPQVEIIKRVPSVNIAGKEDRVKKVIRIRIIIKMMRINRKWESINSSNKSQSVIGD